MDTLNNYKIVWHKNEKYSVPISRETWIKTNGGRISAINSFIKECGNPKEVTIEKAEEYTAKGMTDFEPNIIKQNGNWVAV